MVREVLLALVPVATLASEWKRPAAVAASFVKLSLN
jgi:hypothetical protein